MTDVIRLVGPNNAVEIFAETLVGVNATNGRKVLFTVAFVLLVMLAARALRRASWWLVRSRGAERAALWTRQGINLTAAAVTLFILKADLSQSRDIFETIAVVTALSIVAHSSTDVLVARWFRRVGAGTQQLEGSRA